MTLFILLPVLVEAVSEPETIALPMSDVTYLKDFSLQVHKESGIIVALPAEDTVEIAIEDVIDQIEIPTSIDSQPDGVAIVDAPEIPVGEMEISSSAINCQASVFTENGFKLVGREKRVSLVEYEILYTSGEGTQTTKTFGNNSSNTQEVDCNTASLDMQVIRAFGNTPADAYEDVIRISVEAET